MDRPNGEGAGDPAAPPGSSSSSRLDLLTHALGELPLERSLP